MFALTSFAIICFAIHDYNTAPRYTLAIDFFFIGNQLTLLAWSIIEVEDDARIKKSRIKNGKS